VQHLQSETRNSELHGLVAGLAQRIAERKIGKRKPGCAAVLNNIKRTAGYYGWNAVLFEMSRNQTHGLVTHGSQRNQKYGVGLILDDEIK